MTEIKAALIFEMLGRPIEHLVETFNKFMDALSKESGLSIISKKISEPKKIEKGESDLYSSFAETEIEFNDLTAFMKAAFTYMPSHIEVLSPSELRMKNFEINSFMNALVMKLHQYDEAARALMIEKQILQKKLEEKNNNLIKKEEIIESKNKTSKKAKKK